MDENFWAFLNERKHIYWKGFSRKDRNVCIYEIETIVSKYGFIIDFHMFSDIEIGINIEIEEYKIFDLYTELRKTLEIDDYDDLKSKKNTERTILLNVTFLQGTGDKRIEGPIGPG